MNDLSKETGNASGTYTDRFMENKAIDKYKQAKFIYYSPHISNKERQHNNLKRRP
jgi:hypothetical protein